MSIGALVRQKKGLKDFQDGHLEFPIRTILYFLPSFVSTGLSLLEKNRKIVFQDGSHGGNLGFPIGMIVTIFDLQIAQIFHTKFRVPWPRCVGGEVT